MSFKNSGNFWFCYVVGLCDALAFIVHIVFCIVINLKEEKKKKKNVRKTFQKKRSRNVITNVLVTLRNNVFLTFSATFPES